MCVEGYIEVTQEDDPSFLEVARGDKIYKVIPFREDCRGRRIRFHVRADYRGASEGCTDIESVQTLVSIVGCFAHSSVEPAFVEECDNSPTFTLVAAVGREDEVGKSCRVSGRDVVL